MAITPDQLTHAMDDFGANDWLIEELFDQYTADPASVDPAWAAYFSGGDSPAGPVGSAPAAAPAGTTAEWPRSGDSGAHPPSRPT